MTLFTVFKQMGFEFPLKVENNDVAGSLKFFFDVFYNQLISLRSLDHQSGGVHFTYSPNKPIEVYKLGDDILSVISKYSPENHIHAYSSFSRMIPRALAYLSEIPYQPREVLTNSSFYRVRPINGEKEPFDRKDLFHISFSETCKVKNYRYSLQKEPALYLSSSVPSALQETRLKDVSYAVSRYELLKPISIFNVDYSYYLYHRFEEVMKDQPEVFLFLGMILPIVAACSIKVHPDNEKKEIKEEYIIPQLLMKYVQEHRTEYQGIRYYSTRINLGDPKQHQDQYNLVLPTKKTASSGYDENLKKLFRMTDVVNVKDGKSPQQVEQKLKQMQAYDIDF